jgi:predicted transcriptional regulator
MPKALPPLGDLEHEIAQLIWTHGAMTAATVRKRIPRPLKDPTVRTVLRRLEDKGYLIHTVESGTFIYHAKEAQDEIAARAVKRIVDKFCNGSVEQVLTSMVKAALIEPRELQTIVDKMTGKKRTKPR